MPAKIQKYLGRHWISVLGKYLGNGFKFLLYKIAIYVISRSSLREIFLSLFSCGYARITSGNIEAVS